MMGGVHQLKAMFEKTSDSISPDRGPLGAFTVERSPTPLSKVRTSFIAVQGSGQRSNSTESAKQQKNSLTTEIEKSDGSSTDKSMNKTKQALGDRIKENSGGKEPEISIDVVSKNNLKKTRPSSDGKAPTAVSLTSNQNGIISSASAARKSPKSAINPSTKRSDRKENESNATRAHKSSRINGDFKTRPSISNHSIRNKIELEASPRHAFLRRFPPKSPINQVHLSTSPKVNTAPSSLRTTRITPSSTNQPIHRQTSGRIHPPTRSQSRISTVSNFSSVSKSQISKRRSVGLSLSEEKNKKTHKESITSRPATPEPGFLARMMRPTTSSASKAAEKPVPIARPIKSNTRQTVKNTANDGLSKLEQRKKISTVSKSQNQDTSRSKPTTSDSKNPSKKPLSKSTTKSKKSKESDISIRTSTSKVLLDQNTSKSLEQGNSVNLKEVTTQPANSHDVSLQKQDAKISPSADLEHFENPSGPIFTKLVTITNIDQTPNSEITAQSPLKIKEKADLDESQEMNKVNLNTNSPRNGEAGTISASGLQSILEIVNTEKTLSDSTEPKSYGTTNITESEKKVEDKNMNEFKQNENTALHVGQDKFAENKLNSHGTKIELPSYENSNDVVEPKQLKSPISSPLTKMEERIADPDISLSLETSKEMAQDYNTGHADFTSSNIIHQPLKDSKLVSSTILMPLPSPSHFDNLESDALPSPSSIESPPIETLIDLKTLTVD